MRFDTSQDNDDAIDMPMFDGLSEDPLDLMIELEKNMGMSIVEALRLERGVMREEMARQRKLVRHGRH